MDIKFQIPAADDFLTAALGITVVMATLALIAVFILLISKIIRIIEGKAKKAEADTKPAPAPAEYRRQGRRPFVPCCVRTTPPQTATHCPTNKTAAMRHRSPSAAAHPAGAGSCHRSRPPSTNLTPNSTTKSSDPAGTASNNCDA